jgi:hypothetical protein
MLKLRKFTASNSEVKEDSGEIAAIEEKRLLSLQRFPKNEEYI